MIFHSKHFCLIFIVLFISEIQVNAQFYWDVLAIQYPYLKNTSNYLKPNFNGHVKEAIEKTDGYTKVRHYNKDGWFLSEKEYYNGKLEHPYEYVSYDSNGRPSVRVLYDEETLTYNPKGQLCKSVDRNRNHQNSTDDKVIITEIKYTPTGKLHSVLQYTSKGFYDMYGIFSYDQNGNIKSLKCYRYFSIGWHLSQETRYYYSDNHLQSDTTTNYYRDDSKDLKGWSVYNKMGLPTEVHSYSPKKKLYTYNAKDQLLTLTIDNCQFRYRYNAKGNLASEEKVYNSDEEPGETKTYTYTFYTAEELKKAPKKNVKTHIKKVEKDPLKVMENNGEWEKAFKYIKGRAVKGDADFQLKLAVYYQTGTGTEQNDSLSFTWMQKSAELGNAEAQYHLGNFYGFGFGVQKDIQKSLDWLTKSANQNYLKAIYSVGLIHVAGLRPSIPEDMEKGLIYLRKAAERGFEPAQFVIKTWEKTIEKKKSN